MLKKFLSCTGFVQQVGNIPLNVWEFCIDGYQPAQKWLKTAGAVPEYGEDTALSEDYCGAGGDGEGYGGG